jgi:hypothetical protein
MVLLPTNDLVLFDPFVNEVNTMHLDIQLEGGSDIAATINMVVVTGVSRDQPFAIGFNKNGP